jgi:hypothetical protein
MDGWMEEKSLPRGRNPRSKSGALCALGVHEPSWLTCLLGTAENRVTTIASSSSNECRPNTASLLQRGIG